MLNTDNTIQERLHVTDMKGRYRRCVFYNISLNPSIFTHMESDEIEKIIDQMSIYFYIFNIIENRKCFQLPSHQVVKLYLR